MSITLDMTKYVLFVKIANIFLLILLLFTPFMGYSSNVEMVISGAVTLSAILAELDIPSGIVDRLISLVDGFTLVVNVLFKIIPVIFIVIYLLKNFRAKKTIKLNKGATISIIAIALLVWYLTKNLDTLLESSLTVYIAALVSVFLIVAHIFVSDALKAALEKGKQLSATVKGKTVQAYETAKDKSAQAYASVKQNSIEAGTKVTQRAQEIAASEKVAELKKLSENTAENIRGAALVVFDKGKEKLKQLSEKKDESEK